MTASLAKGLFIAICGVGPAAAAETLGDALRAANVPGARFVPTELAAPITSYAVSPPGDEPFLLAYYVDDGSGVLQAPLHVVRYGRATGDLRRADLRDITALFQGGIPVNCLGSALRAREYRGTVYIETHRNPSSGCVIVLSPELAFRYAYSGWVLGLMGADYAILRASEVHFMSVHPLHVAVLEVKRNRLVEVYPFPRDPERRRFSGLIAPHISEKWCMESNAQCDPENFNAGPKGELQVNEAAAVFGFQAEFDAGGFGAAAAQRVPPRTVAYIYRRRGDAWEHRVFEARRLEALFGMGLRELVAAKPHAAFERAAGQ
jgi:hypothetical protein